MPITPLPTAPSRKQSPSAFAENADAFLGQLPRFAAEATTLEQTVNAAEAVVNAAKSSAISAKNAAQAAQAAAEAVAYAAAWAAGTAYTAGQCVYGTDGQTYRAMAASKGVNPVGDATGKWALISAGGLFNSAWGRGFVQSDSAADARTSLELGTAAIRDVGTASGNVMEVGAFGLGRKGVDLPEGADLNDYITNGFYRAGTTGTALTVLNSPVSVAFGLTVLPAGAYPESSSFQILKPFNSQSIWTRYANNGVWSEWQEILHTGNILSTTGQSTQYPMTQKAVTDALNTKANTSALGTAATRDVGTDSGNVMQVGAFGLGQHGVDFPTIDNSTVIAAKTSFLRGPGTGKIGWASGYGQAILFKRKEDHATIIEGAANRLWFQGMLAGVLTGWNEVIHTNNILSTTGQSTEYPMTQKAVTDALNTKVGLSDNQTIAGTKTFSSFPVTPSAAPTTSYQVANKKYVDDKAGSGIGVGQTWQNVSRTVEVTYTNSTGKPIQVGVQLYYEQASAKFYVDGLELMSSGAYPSAVWAVIPPGSRYKVTGGFSSWVELR